VGPDGSPQNAPRCQWHVTNWFNETPHGMLDGYASYYAQVRDPLSTSTDIVA
jgi:hypothetical protein